MPKKKIAQDEVKKLREDSIRAIASFINWANYGANYIGEKFGDEEVDAYFRYIGEKFVEPFLAEGDPLEIIRALNWFHIMEGSDVRYEEDEKIARTIVEKCNTGGRMRRAGITGKNMAGHPMSWYCYHCKLWWQDMLKEKGYNFVFTYNVDGPCIYAYYKKEGQKK